VGSGLTTTRAAGFFDPHRASCGGALEPAETGVAAWCPAPVVAAGLNFVQDKPAQACWGFACPVHADALMAARPLWDKDRAELTRRRRAESTGGSVSATLAVGVAARNLVAQARGWAGRNQDRLYQLPAVQRDSTVDVSLTSDLNAVDPLPTPSV
jgi:hypothetical protein